MRNARHFIFSLLLVFIANVLGSKGFVIFHIPLEGPMNDFFLVIVSASISLIGLVIAVAAFSSNKIDSIKLFRKADSIRNEFSEVARSVTIRLVILTFLSLAGYFSVTDYKAYFFQFVIFAGLVSTLALWVLISVVVSLVKINPHKSIEG